MKRISLFVLLVLVLARSANAQAGGSASQPFGQAAHPSLFSLASNNAPAAPFASSAGSASLFPAAAPPAADPSPATPKFVYGSRDDYRWQLGLGVSVFRFRSSIFTATAVGTSTSLAYFTNEWFALEGNVTTGFAPQIFDREHVKLLGFTGGPKIAWRQRRWEPWAHALFGGLHVQPQTIGNSRNGYDLQLGGGADWRWNPRLSFRLEGDYVRSGLYNETQNNGSLTGGVVFHF